MIRTYIDILEHYCPMRQDAPVLVESDIVVESQDVTHDELAELVERLRAYAEPTGGEYAAAFEQGLEMAASMIENLVNRKKNSES